MKNKLCYIFDMDGVLVNSLGAYYAAYNGIFEEKFGITLDCEYFLSVSGMIERDVMSLFCKKHGISADSDELVREGHGRLLLSGDMVQPIECNVSLALALAGAGYPIAVASGSSSDFVSMCMERIGLSDKLSAVVTADDVKVGKPDPEVFLKAAEKLGATPSDCVVIEDAQFGVEAAKAANMRVLHYMDS